MAKTSKRLILTAQEKFGDNFDYSEISYKNSVTEIKIRCKKHDHTFRILFYSHVIQKFGGCKFCESSNVLDSNILKAKEKFGDNFDYSDLEYKNSLTKIKIRCKKHGHTFRILFCNHMARKFGGCNFCGSILDSYLLKAKEKFRDNFDYSEVEYKTSKQKIKIRCKKHDHTFHILFDAHLERKYAGCRFCKEQDKLSEIKRKLQDGEEIKELPWDGFKDLYCVTTFGRVFNKKKGTELSPSREARVPLYCAGQVKIHGVHNLVWKCCEGLFDRKKWMIYRKDRNKKNNRIDNLVKVTTSFTILRYHLLNSIKSRITQQEANVEEKIILGEEQKTTNRSQRGRLCTDFKSIGIIDGCNFSHYTINSHGVLNNTLTDKKRTPKHGYLRFTSEQGKRNLEIYKLVAKVHLKNGETYFSSINNEVNHKDGNKKNSNAENLEWIMNSNVVDTSDFKSVGTIYGIDFSHYEINSQGTIINTKKKNKIIKACKDKQSGYLSWYLLPNKQILIHRLVGKVKLKKGEEFFKKGSKKYVVNHKDKNRANNCVENLEWVTPSGNAAHACGIKVVRIDLKTGEDLQTYNTMAEAGKHLKKLLNRDKIWVKGIGKTCRGKQESSHGYGWRYADADENGLDTDSE